MNVIDKIPVAHYKSIQFRNELLWKSYEQLNGFLNKNFDVEFHEILAKPFVSGDHINWHSSIVGDFKPLDSFSLAQKQNSLLKYHTLLVKVREKISTLRQSVNSDNQIWADMLSLTFNEKNNIIYASGSNFVLLWGFEFNNEQENYIDPALLAAHLLSLETQSTSQLNIEKENEPILESEVKETIDHTNYQSVGVGNNDHLIKKIIVRSNKKQQSKNGFLYNFWWTLILIPLLLFFLFYEYNHCGFLPSKNNAEIELIKILPQDPLKRPPIDTSKLIKGDSGLSKIVSNVFNIALKDKTKDLGEFALELKKSFPDSLYKIVFFDTSTSRLQFQFPDSNRNQLKEDIRDKMDDYELLIWDESIFTNSRTFNDPIFSDASKSWYLMASGAPAAWDITSGNKDVVIAVIDDGFDISNPDLINNIIKPYNVESRNKNITANDTRFHGTHVAGLALGKADNGFGITGIAPNCSFMPVQITETDEVFTSSDVIDGILYAIKNGADVINLSLGKYFPEEVSRLSLGQQQELLKSTGQDEQEFWDELFSYAEKENTIIVMASGNQHIMVGLDPMQRSLKTIKVSAINSKLEPASFSNFGNDVTIYAPGENIYSIVPGKKEKFMDGTSMASPIVAGAVGLMKSKNKDIKIEEVIKLLKNTSDPIKGNDGKGSFIRIDKLLKSMK